MNDKVNNSNCWFCKTRQAVSGCEHKFDLHRVLEHKETYIVVGISHEKKYETTKVLIPRCKQCETVHDRVGLVFFLLWLILGIVASVYYFQSQEIPSNIAITIIGGIAALGLSFLIAAIPVGILFYLTNLFWKSTGLSTDYPEIKELLNTGWEEGEKPHYK